MRQFNIQCWADFKPDLLFLQLNQTFQDWIHKVYVGNIR